MYISVCVYKHNSCVKTHVTSIWYIHPSIHSSIYLSTPFVFIYIFPHVQFTLIECWVLKFYSFWDNIFTWCIFCTYRYYDRMVTKFFIICKHFTCIVCHLLFSKISRDVKMMLPTSNKPRLEITWLFWKPHNLILPSLPESRADDFKSKVQEVACPLEKKSSFEEIVSGHNFHSLPHKTGLLPCRFSDSLYANQHRDIHLASCEHWGWFSRVPRWVSSAL